MAAFDTTTTHFGGRSFATRLAHAAHGLIAAVAQYNQRRATRVLLDRLTDRELDDIGLTRWDIHRM